VERPALEVADIFRDFGPEWRDANRGHVSHAQLKVMSAIEVAAAGHDAARPFHAPRRNPAREQSIIRPTARPSAPLAARSRASKLAQSILVQAVQFTLNIITESRVTHLARNPMGEEPAFPFSCGIIRGNQ
jgi:hypothetical protein